MKHYSIILLVICILFTLGCFSSCCDSSHESDYTNITYDRVAVLFSSLADAWTDAGGKIDITVAESIERGFASEGTLLVDDGAGKNINTEVLLSYSPDLVIYSSDIPAQTEAAQLCELAGIKTMPFKIESFDDYLNTMMTMCAITGNDNGYKNALDMSGQIKDIVTNNSHENSYLFVRSGTSASSTKAKRSKDHFACAIIDEFGLNNIIDQAPLLSDSLNSEVILEQDPDYIFFSIMGDEKAGKEYIDNLLTAPEWSTLSAVKNGHTYILPKDLFHFKPNSRWVQAYEYIGNLLSE